MIPFLDFIKHPTDDQPWHFRVTATNGKILCWSESYVKYTDCAHAAEVALRLSTRPERFHAVAMSIDDLSARAYNIRRIIQDD